MQSVEVPLTFDNAHPIMSAVPAAAKSAHLAGSDGPISRDYVAAAAIDLGTAASELALTAAGAAWGERKLADRLLRQRELVRRNASQLMCAGVTCEQYESLFSTQWTNQEPYKPGPDKQRRSGVRELADFLVPDAMWYQILSPGHIDKLGEPPPGVAEISDGRFELTIGQPEQWLPGHPDRDGLLQHGRLLLNACMVTWEQERALLRERYTRIPWPATTSPSWCAVAVVASRSHCWMAG